MDCFDLNIKNVAMVLIAFWVIASNLARLLKRLNAQAPDKPNPQPQRSEAELRRMVDEAPAEYRGELENLLRQVLASRAEATTPQTAQATWTPEEQVSVEDSGAEEASLIAEVEPARSYTPGRLAVQTIQAEPHASRTAAIAAPELPGQPFWQPPAEDASDQAGPELATGVSEWQPAQAQPAERPAGQTESQAALSSGWSGELAWSTAELRDAVILSEALRRRRPGSRTFRQ